MVIYAPDPVPATGNTLFLAGSIDMGTAPDWQSDLIQQLADTDYTFLNPRRKDWDSSWEQVKTHPQFREQVEWELAGMERADLIVMYITAGSKAPVSMIELGLFARSGKMIVCCENGFWRKGNVDIVCERYGVRQVDSLAALILEIQQNLG